MDLSSLTDLARQAPVVRQKVRQSEPVTALPTGIPRIKPTVKLVAPAHGGTYLIDKGAKKAHKKMTFAWKVDPPDAELRVRLWEKRGSPKKPVLNKIV